jgi:predicted TIM-barrel fold metal-dependent hydrolase
VAAYFDSLVHVTADGRWFNTSFDASEARLLREMDQAAVERAVVVALAGVIANDFVLDVCRRHAGRLIPGASLNPVAAPTAEVVASARGALRDGPCEVLKLHPRLNAYDVLDAKVLALLDEMAGWSAAPPIWLDSLLYPKGVTMRLSPVASVRHLAERYPGLRFMLLHAGGASALAFFEALASLPNVMFDLSYSLTRYQATSVALDHRFLTERFDRRTAFGSDFPEVPIPDAVRALEALVEGLPEEKANNVRHGTLARLLDERGGSPA